MDPIVQRTSMRFAPNSRRGPWAGLRRALAGLSRPARARCFDPKALSAHMSRDLGFHDADPTRRR